MRCISIGLNPFKDPKPDMFFKIAGESAPVGVSIKQANAGSLLSGDNLLRPFVTAAIAIAKKNPKVLKALQGGDVKFNLKDMGDAGVSIAYGSIFGGGTNTVKYLVKGDFAKAIPKLNPKTGDLEYPPNSVKIYADASHNNQGKAAAVDAFAKGEGVYPQVVFRKGEGASEDKKGRGDDVGGGRNVRPIITYETRGGATDLSGDVSGEKDWQDAVKKVLNKIDQTPPASTDEAALRTLVGELLLEDLTPSDKSDIKRMISKEIEGVTNRRQIEKVFQTQFDKELRKALGVSFFGTPGKINKFVVDAINDEVSRILGDKATVQMIADITKEVLVRLYKELSFHQDQVIRRIKV